MKQNDLPPAFPRVLQRRFFYFKSLLAANNTILEELAGLERMIYEGRSFTLEYAEHSIRRLLERCCSLVEDLNAMIGGTRTELFDRTERIGTRAIEALSRRRPHDSSVLIMELDDIGLEHMEEVGGKAANLGEIRNRIGLPTPDGFAVTASAAALFLRHTGLMDTVQHQLADVDPADIGLLERICAQAGQRIMAAPLPPVLGDALHDRVRKIIDDFGRSVRLAVRSSAVCEDSEASFAGQHASVLGTPPATLPRAWSAVLASAFTARAVYYRRARGYTEHDVMMSVLVLNMIRATAGGVLYTIDPNSSHSDDLIISAAWGLGVSVVDGATDVDVWRIGRHDRRIHDAHIGLKKTRFDVLPQGGIVSRPVAKELQRVPCLADNQLHELIDYGLRLEKHYGHPQDVEWAVDERGRMLIVQSRPLQRAAGAVRGESCHFEPGSVPLMFGGQAAATGVAAGPAYLMQPDHALADVPAGAILVARQTSPIYVAAMGRVAGIITEVGSTTGHMASVAREFGIPTLVGVSGAMHLLPHGHDITLDATNGVIYAGRMAALTSERKPVNLMQGSPVYKAVQEAMTHLAPLHLIDPYEPDFTPAACRTVHDIIRFCHEESMQAMFRLPDTLSPAPDVAHELRTMLPFRIMLLDLGGGVVPGSGTSVTTRDLTCQPLAALLNGMTSLTPHTRVRHAEAASYAIISSEYVNFSGRLGSHFATVDAWTGPVINDNYITFSFNGGAADYARRVRRASLLAGILRRLGFRVRQTEDALRAEIRKYDGMRLQDRLHTLGRLLMSVRSLDNRLQTDTDVTQLIDAFFQGGYTFSSN